MSNWVNIKKLSELYVLKLNKENNYTVKLPNELQHLNLDDMVFSINHLNSPNKFTGFNLQMIKNNDNTITSNMTLDVLTFEKSIVKNVTTAGFDYTTVKSRTFSVDDIDYVSTRVIGGDFHGIYGYTTSAISIEVWIDFRLIKTVTSDISIGLSPVTEIRHFLCEFDLDLTDVGNHSSLKLKCFAHTSKGIKEGIEMSAGMGGGYEVNFYKVQRDKKDIDMYYELDLLCFKEVY